MRRCWKDWRGLKWDDFLLFFSLLLSFFVAFSSSFLFSF